MLMSRLDYNVMKCLWCNMSNCLDSHRLHSSDPGQGGDGFGQDQGVFQACPGFSRLIQGGFPGISRGSPWRSREGARVSISTYYTSHDDPWSRAMD